MEIYEKIGDYKREMKKFVKGLVKSKLFQNEDGDLTIFIEKIDDKETKQKTAALTAELDGFTAVFKATVATRVFNKIEPALFDALGEQLARSKNFGKLVVK